MKDGSFPVFSFVLLLFTVLYVFVPLMCLSQIFWG